MAGRYKGIWYFDNTNAGAKTALTFIKKVRWVSKTATAGDQVILKDEAGNVVWESCAPAANFTDKDDLNRQATFTVDTITSGHLYLYE